MWKRAAAAMSVAVVAAAATQVVWPRLEGVVQAVEGERVTIFTAGAGPVTVDVGPIVPDVRRVLVPGRQVTLLDLARRPDGTVEAHGLALDYDASAAVPRLP